MSREAFDIEAALEKCHAGTAWQRDLIHAQLIAAQADAFERAAMVCLGQKRNLKDTKYVRRNAKRNLYLWRCADAIRALAKEPTR